MFKKFILFYCLILISSFSLVVAADNYPENAIFINYSPQLKDAITTMRKLPEVKTLMATIQKEGPLSILVDKNNKVCEQFGACWDTDNRIIYVNEPTKQSKGELIGSILFELQNASVNSNIRHYDELASKGQIGREDYVRAIEFLEYQNSLRASKLAEKGIALGLFPPSAHLETYSSFEEHYRIQKKGGHTAWIAYNYNQIAPRVRTQF